MKRQQPVFDRGVFFDNVRADPFGGSMTQSQVEGCEAIMSVFERFAPEADRRWLGYCYATAFHETSQEMQPIAEYGKGSGQSYGATDPETGQAYYGRGYVQLTWRDNYRRADDELRLGHQSSPLSCEWHADNAMRPAIAAAVMFVGMVEGWFRSDDDGRQTLERYFNDDRDDPYTAREIINGDKHIVPDWSAGVPIGNLIAEYYMAFTAALNYAADAVAAPGERRVPRRD